MSIVNRIKTKIHYYWDFCLTAFAKVCSLFTNNDNTWMVCEKLNEARDNGFWFYRYLRLNHPELKVYYVIEQQSPDYGKICQFGEEFIIKPYSVKHRILFLSCGYCICSQPPLDYFDSYSFIKKVRNKKQKTVFLQHGIIKDNLFHVLDASYAGIDIFITSAKREKESVMSWLGYSDKQCALTGLCRFDNLSQNDAGKSHIILVMPTFRHWLLPEDTKMVPTSDERRRFCTDAFCKEYKDFLYSPDTLSVLNEYDYKIVFYPHYCAQPFLECFANGEENDRIILGSREKYDVQRLLIESDILITDYSSVFFDFAYMKKPEIFFQFDEKRYREGHYEEGYFVYRRDAFGPVYDSCKGLIGYLRHLLENHSSMEPIYKQKVDDFFEYTDSKNCERTYSYIINYRK